MAVSGSGKVKVWNGDIITFNEAVRIISGEWDDEGLLLGYELLSTTTTNIKTPIHIYTRKQDGEQYTSNNG